MDGGLCFRAEAVFSGGQIWTWRLDTIDKTGLRGRLCRAAKCIRGSCDVVLDLNQKNLQFLLQGPTRLSRATRRPCVQASSKKGPTLEQAQSCK